MASTQHPFDGGPVHPTSDVNAHQGVSIRALIFAHVVGHGAFDRNGGGEFRCTPEQAAKRALEITDAGLDALEIRP